MAPKKSITNKQEKKNEEKVSAKFSCSDLTKLIKLHCSKKKLVGYKTLTKALFTLKKQLWNERTDNENRGYSSKQWMAISKWFERRSNTPWLKKIIGVIGVPRLTVVCDWRFDNLCWSHHLQSEDSEGKLRIPRTNELALSTKNGLGKDEQKRRKFYLSL